TAASDRLISCSSCWDFATASGSLEHKPATSLTRVITHELQRRGQHLASVLQEGRENTNIDAGLGFIWRISVKAISCPSAITNRGPVVARAYIVKVLHVIPAVAPRYGGASHAVLTMCSALQTQGIEILIATTDADGNEKLPVALGEKTIYQDIATIFFIRQWSEAFKYSRPLAVWLERNVKNFDLVHIHAIFSHACVAAAAACRKRRVPYLVRPLGALDPWSLKQKSGRKRIIWHLGVKQMLTGAAHIHYTTADEKLLAETGLGLTRGVVVPERIDLSFAERKTAPFGDAQPQVRHNPYVLALSRIHPKKGFELLIESFAALKKSGLFGDWRLVFAGDGIRCSPTPGVGHHARAGLGIRCSPTRRGPGKREGAQDHLRPNA